MSISDYLKPRLLDLVFNNTSLSPVVQPYVSVHSSDPGGTGASEIGGTTRQAGSFGAAVDGALANDVALNWTSMPMCTVSHIGIWDNSVGGNFLWGGPLVIPKTVGAGDTFQIPVDDLDVTLT